MQQETRQRTKNQNFLELQLKYGLINENQYHEKVYDEGYQNNLESGNVNGDDQYDIVFSHKVIKLRAELLENQAN